MVTADQNGHLVRRPAVGVSAEVVDAFLAAVVAKKLDAALALVTDDVSYENVPIDPIVGKDAMGAVLAGFLEPAAEVDWQILRQHEVDNLVINERLDRFRIGDGWLELPIAGFFEVTANGLISRWRDYFDMATYTRQLQALTAGG
jgi:limonene-1,2-epoxide hydrolase